MLHFPSPDIGMFGRRQRYARGYRIPVSIVADAGAGAQDRDTAVVVDEYGTDEALLAEIGCGCCTVRVKLQAALRKLLMARETQHFGRVVIETRQDVAPILRTFATTHALGAEYYLDGDPPLSGNTFTLTEATPLSWDAFSRFMTTLIALRGADMLQVKGSLNVDGCRGPVVVHGMQHLSLPPVELQAWSNEGRTSRLEFVTRGVDEKIVRNLFDAIRALT